MKHLDTITLEGSIDQMRTRIAIEQGAMHQVQLSVARWRGDAAGAKREHDQGPAMASSQAEWHAAAQCHFLCWLAHGGFAQASAETDVAVPAGTAGVALEETETETEIETQAETKAAAQIVPAACHNCTA